MPPCRLAALVALLGPRPRPGLGIGVDGEDAVADRQPAPNRKLDQRARRLLRHDLEMQRFAANDATERDRALVRLAGRLGRIDRDRDGGGDFERAGNADPVEGRARFLERACGPLEQGFRNILVEARLHDEDARAFEIACILAGGPARLGHIGFSAVAGPRSKRIGL